VIHADGLEMNKEMTFGNEVVLFFLP